MLIQIIFTALVSGLPGQTTPSVSNRNRDKAGMTLRFQDGYPPIVALELFTSQGCSSCTPSDALLQEVRDNGGTSSFTLSYHVD